MDCCLKVKRSTKFGFVASQKLRPRNCWSLYHTTSLASLTSFRKAFQLLHMYVCKHRVLAWLHTSAPPQVGLILKH